jgi:hypothetical protein
MSTQHTPGPWSVSQNVSRHVIGKNGGVVACAELTWTAEISEANARLIAAAPDLLNALVMVLDDSNALDGRPRTAEVVYAAIAKATGAA